MDDCDVGPVSLFLEIVWTTFHELRVVPLMQHIHPSLFRVLKNIDTVDEFVVDICFDTKSLANLSFVGSYEDISLYTPLCKPVPGLLLWTQISHGVWTGRDEIDRVIRTEFTDPP